MFKKEDNQTKQPLTPNVQPSVADPWVASEDIHFPTPLELDRLLRPDHLMIAPAAAHLAIAPTPAPSGYLTPPHSEAPAPSLVELLLEHELKLSPDWLEGMQIKMTEVLGWLYWSILNTPSSAT